MTASNPFLTGKLTEKHQRHRNEDYCDSFWSQGCGCWVVADGLGGHKGGEVASQLAVARVIAAFAKKPEISSEAIERYLAAAQQTLLQRQKEDPRLSGMRTTIVVLVTNEASARWGHIGDSRIYHFRHGRIINQTKDHSVPQALANSGEITNADIRFHEDRHRLLRALGQEDDFRPTIIQDQQALESGEVFLLCTDGFWELVLEAEMEADLNGAASPQEWLQRMERRICTRTGQETGKKHDNYSALAVFYTPIGA
jgi:serine/threonine protein phosphatase PrpC